MAPPTPPSALTDSVAVVLVPLPSQGHLNQFLHLALNLAGRGLPVHYAAPSQHLLKTQSRFNGWPSASLGHVQFHPLHLPSFPSPQPDPGGFFPAHLQPLFDVLNEAAEPLRELLAFLATGHRRVVVVHDRTCNYAAVEAARLDNCEAYTLTCVPVSFVLGWFDPTALAGRGLVYPSHEDCVTEEFMKFAHTARLAQPVEPAGLLFNTCMPIEAEFVDSFRQSERLFKVGPLHPVVRPVSEDGDAAAKRESLVWLDKQPPASVLYVSFGSTTTLTQPQIGELAAGLISSGQAFLWVFRNSDRADMSGAADMSSLSPDFERECEGRGKVIRDWAPQLDILAHPATAAFMSHCGWNSTLESLSHGVPLLTWPVHSDQPWNAVLVCEHLRAGLPARPWERRKEMMTAKEIEAAVRRVMIGEEGMEARGRARALGDDIRRAVADGGTSRVELDAFVAHITR